MVATAESVEWIAGPQRRRGADARVQPHQAAPAPLQHPAAGRQELPVPRRHARRRVAPGDGDAGRRSARASATSGRTATPTPSGRRSTCCCARSRSAPARTTSSTATSGWAGRACCSTSRSAAAPCVGEIEPGATTTGSSPSCCRVPRRRHRRRRQPARGATCSEAADELEFERAARLRDRLAAVRKAIEKQQMVDRRSRGLRRHRASPRTSSRRRCRSSSCARAGSSAARASWSTRSRTSRGRSSIGSRARAAVRRAPPLGRAHARCSCRTSPTTATLYEEWLARLRGSQGAASGCRSGATSGRCRRRSPATPRRSSSATGCGASADHNARARALERAAGRARPARGAAAHRVLRHEPHPGHRLRRLDGGDGGRAARRSATTAGSR